MTREDYLTIGEFAELSGVPRKTLIYYDRIDLLKPEKVSDKGFRYYHYHQLYTINMIIALKEVRISLKEIKNYMTEQTPEAILAMLQKQKQMANQRSVYFAKMEQMLDMQIQSISRNLTDDPCTVEYNSYEEVPLFFDESPYSQKSFRFSVSITAFYKYCSSHGYEFPYPSGFVLRQTDLDNTPEQAACIQLYAKVPVSNRSRPKGDYLSIYTTNSLAFEKPYQHLVDYAQKHHLSIDSDFYLDFVANELIADNFNDFRLKMMVRVIKTPN